MLKQEKTKQRPRNTRPFLSGLEQSTGGVAHAVTESLLQHIMSFVSDESLTRVAKVWRKARNDSREVQTFLMQKALSSDKLTQIQKTHLGTGRVQELVRRGKLTVNRALFNSRPTFYDNLDPTQQEGIQLGLSQLEMMAAGDRYMAVEATRKGVPLEEIQGLNYPAWQLKERFNLSRTQLLKVPGESIYLIGRAVDLWIGRFDCEIPDAQHQREYVEFLLTLSIWQLRALSMQPSTKLGGYSWSDIEGLNNFQLDALWANHLTLEQVKQADSMAKAFSDLVDEGYQYEEIVKLEGHQLACLLLQLNSGFQPSLEEAKQPLFGLETFLQIFGAHTLQAMQDPKLVAQVAAKLHHPSRNSNSPHAGRTSSSTTTSTSSSTSTSVASASGAGSVNTGSSTPLRFSAPKVPVSDGNAKGASLSSEGSRPPVKKA